MSTLALTSDTIANVSSASSLENTAKDVNVINFNQQGSIKTLSDVEIKLQIFISLDCLEFSWKLYGRQVYQIT